MCIASTSGNSEYSYRFFFLFLTWGSTVIVCRELHLVYIMGKIGLCRPACHCFYGKMCSAFQIIDLKYTFGTLPIWKLEFVLQIFSST